MTNDAKGKEQMLPHVVLFIEHDVATQCRAPAKVMKTCGYIRIGNEENTIRWLVDLHQVLRLGCEVPLIHTKLWTPH